MNNRRVTEINNLGRSAFEDFNGSEYSTHGLPAHLDRNIFTNMRENRQIISNGSDLGSQTGVLTGQFDKGVKGVKFND